MNDADREEGHAVKQELDASAVDAVSKLRGNRALVLSAVAANGCPTPEEQAKKNAEAMHALTVFMVGFVAHAPASTEAAARKAVADCPMRSAHEPTQAMMATRPWTEVFKGTFIKSPIAMAIIVVALVLAGFGKTILAALGMN